MTSDITHSLTENGLAVLAPLYEQNVLKTWNEKLTPILNSQSTARKYVYADKLMALGILDDVFSPELLRIIFELVPNAELYHCHVYEINANNAKPHIHTDNRLDGWHRDYDCKHSFDLPYIQHISFFIYLSEVNEGDGQFEVSNKKLNKTPLFFAKEQAFKVTGKLGHNFLFDRKAYHRASPNTGTTPRRVLKLSFQRNTLASHKQSEAPFVSVRNKLNQTPNANPLVKQLFRADTEQQSILASKASLADALSPSLADLPEAHQLSFSFFQQFIRTLRDVKFVRKRMQAND